MVVCVLENGGNAFRLASNAKGGMSKRSLTTDLGITVFAAWALTTGWSPEVSYVQLAWGFFAVWVVLLRVWCALRAVVMGSGGLIRRSCVHVLDTIVSLLPGSILVAYGWFAPAAPSITRGGMDVCDLEVGYCVSGTRAFIGFGVVALVFGAIISLCLVISERAAIQARRRREDLG